MCSWWAQRPLLTCDRGRKALHAKQGEGACAVAPTRARTRIRLEVGDDLWGPPVGHRGERRGRAALGRGREPSSSSKLQFHVSVLGYREEVAAVNLLHQAILVQLLLR